jgi:cobaltochelatase CobS
MTASTIDIERQIHRLTGVWASSVGRRAATSFSIGSDEVASLVRDWLLSLGVPTTKVATLSRKGLANSYTAGPKWVRKNLTGGEVIDLSGDDTSVRPDANSLLDQPLAAGASLFPAVPQTPETATAEPTPTEHRAPTAPTAPTALDIEKVLAALRPGLAQANNELRRELRDALVRGIDDTLAHAADKLRAEALDLVRTEVAKIIDESIPRPIELRLPPPKPTKLLSAEPRHKKFDQILRYLSRGRNVYIVGPAGTGKTKLGAQLANALDRKFFPIAQALTKYDVSGYKSPTGEYIGTLLRDAIEFGGLALVDEGDTWAAAAMTFLNAPLANGYCAFPDKVIKVHEEFLCIVAANTYGRGADRKYVGRNPLDAASLNRFAFVEVDYDRQLEAQLFGRGPWVDYCWRVREAIDKLQIPHVVSMRNIDFCVEAAACGDEIDEIASAGLWQGLAPDTIARIKSAVGEPPASAQVIDLMTGTDGSQI